MLFDDKLKELVELYNTPDTKLVNIKFVYDRINGKNCEFIVTYRFKGNIVTINSYNNNVLSTYIGE